MRSALVIARKDLRQRLRDRSAIVIAFVAPLALALIVSGAFGGGFTDAFEARYIVVDADRSELSRAFTREVLRAPQLREQISTDSARSRDAAREIIQRDEASAAFVFPRGFERDVIAGRRAEIDVLRNPDAQIGSEVAIALANAYTDQINAARLSVTTTLRARGSVPDPAVIQRLARAAADERIPIELVDGNIGVREVSGANYFGPAMAVFFLFFTTGFASRSLLAEREQGTLPRMLASPIRKMSVVVGKALSGFVLGLLSLAVMFVTLGLLFGIDWGDPLSILVLSVFTVLAVMGLTALVQLFAKTNEQADAISSAVAGALAIVGGNFFPIFQLPEAIQRISLATPNGWALRGYTDIAYDGAKLGDLGPHLLAIGAFAIVTGGIALFRAKRLELR